ncbi:hypothetical protein EYC84_004615 [Monilinia fructicola]|uniref:Band 7 domain-containing protein n=1 Tax=Monilinia fructicola TaxID=38448 RepID=A0A5M9K3F9_MONFR|nr:hypothetical protein EYC84_004615 [Monilinia fructicola]
MSTSFDGKQTMSDDIHKPFSPTPAGSSSGQQNGYNASRSTPGRTDNPLVNVQPPRREDLQPSYAQILQGDDDTNTNGWYGSMINALGACIGTLGAIPCCVICPNPYKPVSQGNVGLVTKFGRFYRAVDPGLVKINPLSERLIQVDVKIQIVEVPQQVCMTKDNVTPRRAYTQTTLRHVVGARVLQDVIERREEVAQSIEEIIEDVASGWGVQVESMLIKDIIFSNELQDSLSMAAQSKRIGESKVIAARAEVESAKLMRQAADILSSAPAMQIRYLEAMQAMAKSANSKVIFLPSASTIGSQMASALGEGSEHHGASSSRNDTGDFGGQDSGFQRAINAHLGLLEITIHDFPIVVLPLTLDYRIRKFSALYFTYSQFLDVFGV